MNNPLLFWLECVIWGKVVITGMEVVSKDGKTQTRTLKGMNAQGQDVNTIQVYDK
jgi:hypothetical protein